MPAATAYITPRRANHGGAAGRGRDPRCVSRAAPSCRRRPAAVTVHARRTWRTRQKDRAAAGPAEDRACPAGNLAGPMGRPGRRDRLNRGRLDDSRLFSSDAVPSPRATLRRRPLRRRIVAAALIPISAAGRLPPLAAEHRPSRPASVDGDSSPTWTRLGPDQRATQLRAGRKSFRPGPAKPTVRAVNGDSSSDGRRPAGRSAERSSDRCVDRSSN